MPLNSGDTHESPGSAHCCRDRCGDGIGRAIALKFANAHTNVVCFIAAEPSARHMQGAILDVNGGLY